MDLNLKEVGLFEVFSDKVRGRVKFLDLRLVVFMEFICI